MRDNSDLSWERLGKENPYFGVLSNEKYRLDQLTREARQEFFRSGEQHIDRVLATVRRLIGPDLPRRSALDFGCGVGRLVMPLARHFETVTGVDVAPSMLDEARQNCLERHVANAVFLGSDDALAQVTGGFDFIHSFLVFQHIPVARGEAILRQLLRRLNPGGVLAIHFPFRRQVSRFRKWTNALRVRFVPFAMLVNAVRGQPLREPLVQMNSYDIERMLILLLEHGLADLHLELMDEGGHFQALVFARRPVA